MIKRKMVQQGVLLDIMRVLTQMHPYKAQVFAFVKVDKKQQLLNR
jgi:hypothetical protein